MKTISSPWTFSVKIGTIAFCIFGSIGMAWGMWEEWRDGIAPPWWVFPCWIGVVAALLLTSAGFKRVRIDATNMYVSNYRKELSIPLSMIRDVIEDRWFNFHPVTIRLRGNTEFGQAITFMPTYLFFSFWRSHPIVDELMQIAYKNDSESNEKSKRFHP